MALRGQTPLGPQQGCSPVRCAATSRAPAVGPCSCRSSWFRGLRLVQRQIGSLPDRLFVFPLHKPNGGPLMADPCRHINELNSTNPAGSSCVCLCLSEIVIVQKYCWKYLVHFRMKNEQSVCLQDSCTFICMWKNTGSHIVYFTVTLKLSVFLTTMYFN